MSMVAKEGGRRCEEGLQTESLATEEAMEAATEASALVPPRQQPEEGSGGCEEDPKSEYLAASALVPPRQRPKEGGRCCEEDLKSEYLSVEAQALQPMLPPRHPAASSSAATPQTKRPAGLPTPCRGGRGSRRRPPPLEYSAVDTVATCTTSESFAIPPHTPEGPLRDPEGRKKWLEHTRIRNWATAAALLAALIVAVVGLILILDKGEHSFQSLVPPRPKVANIEGLIKFPDRKKTHAANGATADRKMREVEQEEKAAPEGAGKTSLRSGKVQGPVFAQDFETSSMHAIGKVPAREGAAVADGTDQANAVIGVHAAAKPGLPSEWMLETRDRLA
mmetsp:Transcript_32911/g.90890  ORF Transcript_32911/g.90890 Transcript_32911/m.90890 type:complete len:335 (-) Transcript_32911:248-1252(-)